MSARYKARRQAFSLIFEVDQRGEPLKQAFELFSSRQLEKVQPLSESDFVAEAVKGVADNEARIDEALTESLSDWTLERLFAVERSILRLAAWEILYTNTAPEIVRSESIKLAKEYAQPEATPLVSGVLGSLEKLKQ